MTRGERWWPIGAALVVAPIAGTLTAINPPVGVIAAVSLSAITLAISFAQRLQRLFLTVLAVCLFGYTFLGKGFAYLGVAPLFVGEFVLLLGILAAAFGGGVRPALRSPIVWLLLAYAAWGAIQTVPYLGTYKFDALRDAIIWGYGAFALLVSAFLLRLGATFAVPAAYGRWFWWFGFWSAIAGVIYRIAEPSIPRVPGTDIPLLYVKFGDFAVQLAGLATFALLGLWKPHWQNHKYRAVLEWGWWMAWFAGVTISAAASRGGLLSIFIAVATVLVLRPRTRWWKPAIVFIVFALAFIGSNFELDVGQDRKVSAQQIIANIRSIGGGQSSLSNLEETREWRLQWWTDIVDYTVRGPHFWTGKGFGLNLADDDGYGGTERGIPTRSPHNMQMTVLARAGVPGLVFWVVLQLTFAASLLLAYFRARRDGEETWARIDLWILAFWSAFMTNAAFDVYLEGPQGGIWFWSLVGFGIAALETQRRDRNARLSGRPSRAPPAIPPQHSSVRP